MTMLVCEYDSPILSHEGYPDDTGFRIYKCRVLEPDNNCCEDDIIVIKGNNIPRANGLCYKFEGTWKESPKYGMQFQVSVFEEIIPETYKGIVGYLSSGRIDGITSELAEMIYCKFRNDTINILDEDTSRIKEVPGIGEKTCDKIIQNYEKERFLKKVLIRFAKYKISNRVLERVYFEHGKNTIVDILENPYVLTEFGADLKAADRIAYDIKLPKGHTGRVEAIMLETVASIERSNRNVCAPMELFLSEVRKVATAYHIPYEMISKAEDSFLANNKIVYYNNLVYRKQNFDIENALAKEIYRIVKGFTPHIDFDIDAEIKKSERLLNCRLHKIQQEAVRESVLNGMLIISGGPGTGKTTVVNVIRNIFERVLKKDMLFLAPTGRASARMKESSGFPAFTVHKHLHINDDNLMKDEVEVQMEEACAVHDETSMLDMYVALKLFKSIKTGSQLILLGDVEQLPSVGAGAVLRDMIDSGCVPTVFLTKVFRQAAGSNIYLNCRKIVKGNLSLEYGDDFVLNEVYDLEAAAQVMAETFIQEVSTFGLDEVCCLCPLKKSTVAGATAMNFRIQKMINPGGDGIVELYDSNSGTYYRANDRVMNLKNTEDLTNGDLGIITEVGYNYIIAKFGDFYKTYEYNDLDKVTLAYCMTIHKSQGSEFKSVISTLLEEYSIMLQMNLFNTAVSRAKTKFTMVGNKKAMEIAILNTSGLSRYTGLSDKIIYIFDYYGKNVVA